MVSACLLGIPTAYNGSANLCQRLLDPAAQGRILPICPEVAGGLSTPRPPAEIVGGDGGDVLDGRARVVTIDGVDMTAAYVEGAHIALATTQRYSIQMAILKQRSPSCGSSHIYDGTHSDRLVPGQGVAAALLRRYGVTVKGGDGVRYHPRSGSSGNEM